jgi:hypothetical protein
VRRLIALLAVSCGGGGSEPLAPDATPCTPGDVRLQITREPLGPVRLYALVTHEGADAALLVDTGSQISFLSHDGPDGAPNVGEVDFGCERRTLRGRPFHSTETADGRPVVGFLGNDYFLEKQRMFDLPADRIRDGTCPLTWPRAMIENRFDYLFVMAQVDGAMLRLGFDTGAPHTLWLGQDGKPGDQPVSSQDAYGNPLVFYLGSAQLAFAESPARTVPILRIQSFPSLEDSNAAIGGGIDGLLGLTTMGDRRFCIDAVDGSIRFEPL